MAKDVEIETLQVKSSEAESFRRRFATVLRVKRAWCDVTAPEIVAEMKNQLAEATDGPVLIDMAGIEQVDSIGLTVLVAVAKECAANQWAVTVCYDQEHIGRVFKAVRFDKLFEIAFISD